MIFSGARRFGGGPFGVLENNITQTTAVVGGNHGLRARVAGAGTGPGSLRHDTARRGRSRVWGLAAGVLGIVAAVVLRRKLIVDDALPFPTGRATGEVIETIHTAREAAMRRALLLAARRWWPSPSPGSATGTPNAHSANDARSAAPSQASPWQA